jgi:hypothetical protein
MSTASPIPRAHTGARAGGRDPVEAFVVSSTSSSVPSYQTIELSRGSHRSPEEGACVMELASMLAGERFNDHPKSVCRVIAGFLRAYNDAVDRDRRRDLYACAAAVVGTRGSRSTERARVAWMLATLDDLGARWLGRGWLDRLPPRGSCREMIGRRLARALATSDHGHRRALALVDELVAIDGTAPDRDQAAQPGAPADVAGRVRPASDRASLQI